MNLNPSASELPRLFEPPLQGKEGLTIGKLVFHPTCENDRWPVGHGVGSGFARLHCAVYAERTGRTWETSSGTLSVIRIPRYAVLHVFVIVLMN